jgi:hypothetical protein
MHLEVEVIDAPLSRAEARLVRLGNVGRIRVQEGIPEIGRRRFAIGHELGHWCLHEQTSQIETCLSTEIHGYAGSSEELEGNSFASELLMPKKLVLKRYGRAELTLELIDTAASEMLTTLSATAVRLVETSRDPHMVVFSSEGHVRWWQASAKLSGVWLERRQAIDHDSFAWAASEGGPSAATPQLVRPDAWFEHLDHCERLEVYEQSILLGSYGTVVTILSILDIDD